MFFIKTTFLNKALRHIVCALLSCTLVLWAGKAHAQKQTADTANKVKIIIANTGVIEHFQTDSGSYNKFVNDVVVYQGTDTLYCDSLFNYTESKKLEAFGNVRIAQQGGTEGTCDYLRYQSEKKLAYMLGHVILVDGQNQLWTDELTYDLGTKTGIYNRHGTLHSDSTIVSSTSGVYNVPSHDARFTGNVIVSDPQYKIASKDLGYNTETKVETFYDYSVVTSDSGKSVLTTRKGTYDSKNVTAHFTGFSSIWNDGQYIEADSMHYDKITGYGYAIGNVISIDTEQHTTMYCGRADYFRKKRIFWGTIKPVLQLSTTKDTFYMRADTFYSAPMIRVKGKQFKFPQDTIEGKKDTVVASAKILKGNKPPMADSTKPIGDTVVSSTAKTSKRGRRRAKAVAIDTVETEVKTMPAIIDSMWGVPGGKYTMADFIKDTANKPVVAKPKPTKKKKATRTHNRYRHR